MLGLEINSTYSLLGSDHGVEFSPRTGPFESSGQVIELYPQFLPAVSITEVISDHVEKSP